MTGNCRFFGLTVAAENLQTPKPIGRFFRFTWIYPATTSKDGSSLELNFWNGQVCTNPNFRPGTSKWVNERVSWSTCGEGQSSISMELPM